MTLERFAARVCLPIRDGVAVSSTRDSRGRCGITIRFADAQAIVTQDGTDLTCGFGAGVSVDGTYRRISGRVPPFDLNPVRDHPDRG